MNPRALVLGSALGLLALAPAAAQNDGLLWIGAQSPEQVSLFFALPQSDYIKLGFSCDLEKLALTVTFAFEPMAPAGRIGLDLFSDGGAALLDAEIIRLELDDTVLLEAKTQLDEALATVLTTGTMLNIMVEDGADEVPLPTAEEFAPLLEACLVVG